MKLTFLICALKRFFVKQNFFLLNRSLPSSKWSCLHIRFWSASKNLFRPFKRLCSSVSPVFSPKFFFLSCLIICNYNSAWPLKKHFLHALPHLIPITKVWCRNSYPECRSEEILGNLLKVTHLVNDRSKNSSSSTKTLYSFHCVSRPCSAKDSKPCTYNSHNDTNDLKSFLCPKTVSLNPFLNSNFGWLKRTPTRQRHHKKKKTISYKYRHKKSSKKTPKN